MPKKISDSNKEKVEKSKKVTRERKVSIKTQAPTSTGIDFVPKDIPIEENNSQPLVDSIISETPKVPVQEPVKEDLSINNIPLETQQQISQQQSPDNFFHNFELQSENTPIVSLEPEITEETEVFAEPRKSDFSPLILSFVLGIMLTSIAIVVLFKTQITLPFASKVPQRANSTNFNVQKPKFTKLASNVKGYPIIDTQTNMLEIFDLATKNKRGVGDVTACCSSELYFGGSEPLVSPNLFYTAFLEKNTQNLWVLSNETLNKVKVPTNGSVSFITSWSPDSSKLVYFIRRESITSRKEGPTNWDTVEEFKDQPSDGFFIYDIDTGETKRLAPLDAFMGFVGNSNILTKVSGDSDRLVLYDTNTLTADYQKIIESFPFGVSQFSTSATGGKWAFTFSKNPTNDANIVLADFPNKQGDIIDSGDWGEVQWPIVSPDSKQLVYQKQDGVIKPGFPKQFVWHYLVDLDQTDVAKEDLIENPIMIDEGTPKMWIDNNSIIIEKTEVMEDDTVVRKPYIMDVTNGMVTPIK